MTEKHPALQGNKVLFVFGCLDLGGSERQGLYLARYLKENCGAHVRVLALSKKPGRVSELCDEYGIPCEGMSLHWSRFWPQRVLQLYRFLCRLKRLSPDILMPYYSLPNTVCGLVWEKSPARCCIWNQRDDGLLLSKDAWHRTAVSKASAFIANSGSGRDFLLQTYALPQDRVQVIHNGITLSPPRMDRQQWRDRLGLAADDFAACMLANLGPYKDHRSLVRSWQAVSAHAAERGRRAVLLLAGRTDAGEPGLRRLIAELGLTEDVRLLGMVDDVSGLLQASDICVHSSFTEGCPNAVLEAMAAGLPVAGTDIQGIREAIGAEGAAFLTPVGNHGAMSDAITLLMDDAGLRSEYGRALQKRIAEEFSMEQMGSRSASAIADALANSISAGMDS